MPRGGSPRGAAILAGVTLATLFAPVAAAQAEQRGPLAFRRGQWGALLAVGRVPTTGQELDAATGPTVSPRQQVSIGVLRFASPRAAWIADLAFSVTEDRAYDERGQDGAVWETGRATSTTHLALRAGRRAYRAGVSRAAVYRTLGAVVDGTVYHLPRWRSPDPVVVVVDAGVFGDVGGSYLVTRHIGLGASAGAQATYGLTWDTNTASDRSNRRLAASLGLVRFDVTVYF